jgi:hypothetical protein
MEAALWHFTRDTGRGKKPIAMSNVHIGDEMETMNGLEPVISFIHWNRAMNVDGIHISHGLGNLTLTGDHLLLVTGEDGSSN